jgi:hypothetical protein
MSDGFSIEDRRRVVNMGNLHGRDAELGVHAYGTAESGNVKSTVVATRAQRLALNHYRFSGSDQSPGAFHIEFLAIVEINADERMAAVIVFDADEIDAAIAELDARYLAGEAAQYSAVWSSVMQNYVALNRHELPLMTPDAVSVDHRRGRAFAPGDLPAYLEASWELMPQSSLYIADVHRLNDIGAVVTHVVHGTTAEGFAAEWREIIVLQGAGDWMSRCEMFDEEDFDAALARFDELSRPAPRLENAASQAYERIQAHFAARDWDAMAEVLADEVFRDDRRRVVGAELRKGRDAVVAEFSALAEIGVKRMTFDTIATRGERLFLTRFSVSSGDHSATQYVLQVVQHNAETQIAAAVILDIDDIDAAFKELDARYLAGEAASHSQTWTALTQVQAAYNRHEVLPTTEDWVNIDHRRGRAFTPGDVTRYLRATYDVAPNVKGHIEAVHRLTNLGAVATEVVTGTSQEGFDAEWREIGLFAFEGDLICRFEMFDEADLAAALARFEELDRPPSP